MNRITLLFLIAVLAVGAVFSDALAWPRKVWGVRGSWIAEKWEGKPVTNGDTDSPMFLDPYLPTYYVYSKFHPGLKTLWVSALGRPDSETIRRAADAIGLAHVAGMPGLADTVPLLIELTAVSQHPLVRKAAARALIRLDARSAAEPLLRGNQEDGLDTMLLTDPALAQWDYEPARIVWMERLDGPKFQPAGRISAIRSLAQVRHEPAAPLLSAVATDQAAESSLRLAAAQALGTVVPRGHERMAGTLINGSVIDRLVAVNLLRQHQGADAESLLLELAQDDDPSVVAVALQRFLETDPLQVQAIGKSLLAHYDAKVRRLGAEAVSAQETPQQVQLLGDLFNDINPGVRIYARRRLVDQEMIASLGEKIRATGMRQLDGEDWRQLDPDALSEAVKGQWRRLEQAAMLLGALDHEPAADRLIDLLEYPRVEVRTAAATALRRLAIPQTLAQMLAYAERAAVWQRGDVFDPQADPHMAKGLEELMDLDEQMAQLMQAFGLMGYRQAEPLMRLHVPKTPPRPKRFGPQARAAAIWGLGLFYKDTPQEDVAGPINERLSDGSTADMEAFVVRRMAAIALGHMRAEEYLESLTGWSAELEGSDIGAGAQWAIMRITGEQIAAYGPEHRPEPMWFLSPLDSVEDDEFLLEQP